ncbi:indolepyruvate oxidoreductase subunit beta [Abyssisolibacter fermentans]|uniref:indolepyruvate oxidoreductase subunit beta n=1 Tax=Abyssisolibacter fermentans TaxID=1766203 RepID=UPI000829C369|nr:indolepyruvate oxidoreductase subunit beta [Abyssisolibacter fermentans]
MDTKSILLVGVGGQGTILASKILTTGLMNADYDVKMSEIHGMSQRGGSVSTQVRYGKKVYSPIIGLGEADILVSFEEMECYRYLRYLKKDGNVILNDYQMPSAPILSGKAEYPEGLKEEIVKKVDNSLVIDAAKIAKEIGNIKTMNIVLLGALIKSMKLDFIDWEDVIRNNVKEKFIDINIKALKRGMEVV